jgi:hypothetical protein
VTDSIIEVASVDVLADGTMTNEVSTWCGRGIPDPTRGQRRPPPDR